MTRRSLVVLAKKLWNERLALPEATVGEYSITHTPVKRGDKLMVVGMREMIMTGLPKADLELQESGVLHKLVGPEGTWMSDLPMELVSMERELASNVTAGSVLIGGLGLGILPNMIARKSRVNRIVVVERQPEVIQLVQPYLDKSVEVVEDTIENYIGRARRGKFDVALLDTWQGTGEMVWQNEVVPLRRAIGESIPRVYCWQEGTMIGQIVNSIIRKAALPAEMLKRSTFAHDYAFLRALEQDGTPIEKLPWDGDAQKLDFVKMLEAEQKNANNSVVLTLARAFVHRVGSEWWERTFGTYWDEAKNADRQEATQAQVS